MICQVGIDFVVGGGLDGLVQYAFARSDPVLEDDPSAWSYLTLLMAWSLKLSLCLRRQPRPKEPNRSLPLRHPVSSTLETAPSQPIAIEWEHLRSILHGGLLTRQARYLRRALNERQVTLLQVGLRFFREALRTLEFLILGPESPPWVQSLQGELFRHQDVLSLFRLILQTGCSRFSLQALGVLMEVNHLMLKLLKRFCDQRGHIFVCRPLTRIMVSERGGQGLGAGYNVEAPNEETEGPEREFHFTDLLGEYAHEAIIDKFTRLLQNTTSANETSTNRYLAIMLNHFVSGDLQGACTLLFRASLLEAAHSALCYPDRRWRQANVVLVKVCHLLATRFVVQLRERPLLAVAIFFNVHHLLRRRQALHDDPSMADGGGEPNDNDGISLPEHWQRGERISWLVRTLVEAEVSSVISWLAGKLFDAAAARTPKLGEEASARPEMSAEGGAPYYLYAQNDSIKGAMDDPAFRALLRACGLEAPNRGERNWRVPVEMHLDDILEVAQQLQTALHLAIDVDGEGAPDWDAEQRIITNEENDKQNYADYYRNGGARSQGRLSEIPTTLVSDLTGTCGENEGHPVKDKLKRPTGRWAQLKQSNFFLSARPFSPGEAKDDADDDHEDSDDERSDQHVKVNLNTSEDRDRDVSMLDVNGSSSSREGGPKSKRPPLTIYSDTDE